MKMMMPLKVDKLEKKLLLLLYEPSCIRTLDETTFSTRFQVHSSSFIFCLVDAFLLFNLSSEIF